MPSDGMRTEKLISKKVYSLNVCLVGKRVYVAGK